MKRECLIFDENKCNVNHNLHEIILSQYDLIGTKEKINVSDLYMPQQEQDKMAEWIIYKWNGWRVNSIKFRKRKIGYIMLDIFPSAIANKKLK